VDSQSIPIQIDKPVIGIPVERPDKFIGPMPDPSKQGQQAS